METIERLAAFAQVTLTLYAWAVLVYASFRFLLSYYHIMTPDRIDGALFVAMAMAGSAVLALQNDEVYKYIGAYYVFYFKTIANIMLAGATALKGFRYRPTSTTNTQ